MKKKVIGVVSLAALIAGASYVAAKALPPICDCESATVIQMGTATPPSKHATATLMCGTTKKDFNLFPPNGGNSVYNFELLKNALDNGFKVDVCYTTNTKKGIDTITSVQVLGPEGPTGKTGPTGPTGPAGCTSSADCKDAATPNCCAGTCQATACKCATDTDCTGNSTGGKCCTGFGGVCGVSGATGCTGTPPTLW